MNNKNKLEELKSKYMQECLKKKDSFTYRGFLNWLKENDLRIGYFQGLDLKLLEFNNEVFDRIQSEK